MSVLDFLAAVAVSGQVEGAGIQSTPEEWERALGADFIDDRAKKRFRRDYGLVELGFWRVDNTWRCGSLAIQVHRLWWHADSLGPARLGEKYGDFPKTVPFETLRDRLTAVGPRTAPRSIQDTDTGEYTRYYVPASKVVLMVVSLEVDRTEDGLPAGSVWSLNLTDNADAWIQPR